MKRTFFPLIWLILAMALPARAEVALDIKLNFFGPATAGRASADVATSFLVKTTVQRNLQVKFTAESLLTELKKTFNAPDTALLASGDLSWRSGGPASVMQAVQIDGRDYALVLTPLPRPGAVNFKVGVVEGMDKPKIKKVLLDTEIVLPDGEVAMLGFRDSQERSFFIAFYVQERNEEFGKNAMRITGASKPKIVKKVKPVYPEEAVKKRIEGVVSLEALIDKNGKVKDVRMVRSPDPLLTAAAEEALKQWVYEPYSGRGGCSEALFTVTMNFRLNPEGAGNKSGDDALTRLEGSERPRKVKDVKPVYPEEAKQNKIQGLVKLEAKIDEQGKVIDVRVVASAGPLLDKAAMAALRQWEYEPFLVNGKAKQVIFTVTMNFALKKD